MKYQHKSSFFRHLSVWILTIITIPLILIGLQTKATGFGHSIHDSVYSIHQVRDLPHPDCNYNVNFDDDCVANLQSIVENHGFGHIAIDSDHFFRPSLPVSQSYYDSLMSAVFEALNSLRVIDGLVPVSRLEFNFLYSRAQVRNFSNAPSRYIACSNTIENQAKRADFIVCFNGNLNTLLSDLIEEIY